MRIVFSAPSVISICDTPRRGGGEGAPLIFCNAALLSCVLLKFDGQEASVGDGFRAALLRRRQILGWAIVSALVGIALKVIESHKRGGEIVGRVLGTAWTVMTYFAVPVLVVQNVGPY